METHGSDLIGVAKKRTKASNSTAYTLVRLFGRADRREYGFAIYAYFRWLDDIVDSPESSYQEKKSLMERQGEFLEGLYAGRPIPAGTLLEEQLARCFVAFDRQNQFALRNDVLGMFAVLMHDLGRSGEPLASSELNAYILMESRAFVNMIRFFCGEEGDFPGAQDYCEGVACKLVHLLRDFREDLDSGWANIAQEDVAAFGVSLDNINDESFQNWVKSQVQHARDLFAIGKRDLESSHNLRYKVADILYCTKYEDILTTIEKDGFRLRVSYNRSLHHKLWLLFGSVRAASRVIWQHYFGRRDDHAPQVQV